MAHLEPNLLEVRKLYKRVVSVIDSCETVDQLDAAYKYAQLAINKWYADFPKSFASIRHRNMLDNIVKDLNNLLKTKKKLVRYKR